MKEENRAEASSNPLVMPAVGSNNPAPVVCLCGSTKFMWAFMETQARLTFAGNIVISVGCFGHVHGIDHSKEVKAGLDILHYKKIDLADAIMIIDVDGYVGESTAREIQYAHWKRKPVYLMSREYPDLKNPTDCKYWRNP